MQFKAEAEAAQALVDTANLRIEGLEARIATAPQRTTSWRLPLIMIVLGAVLAFAPLNKLRRSKDDEDQEQADADPADGEVSLGTEAAANAAGAGAIALGGGRGQSNVSQDVGEALAVSENRPGAHDWDAELEAAKAALAQTTSRAPSRRTGPRSVAAASPIGRNDRRSKGCLCSGGTC